MPQGTRELEPAQVGQHDIHEHGDRGRTNDTAPALCPHEMRTRPQIRRRAGYPGGSGPATNRLRRSGLLAAFHCRLRWCQGSRGPAAHLACNLESATMIGGDAVDDAEALSVAGPPRRLSANEPPLRLWEVVGRNPHTVIDTSKRTQSASPDARTDTVSASPEWRIALSIRLSSARMTAVRIRPGPPEFPAAHLFRAEHGCRSAVGGIPVSLRKSALPVPEPRRNRPR